MTSRWIVRFSSALIGPEKLITISSNKRNLCILSHNELWLYVIYTFDTRGRVKFLFSSVGIEGKSRLSGFRV